MGAYKTRLSANLAVAHMKTINFIPKTILNIGVGSCPEFSIWRKRLPEVSLLGVDVRGQNRWNAPFVNALVSDQESKNATFCLNCKSLKCTDIKHKRTKAFVVRTIDSIVDETKVEPPYFMWIDIEGGELDALKGSMKILPQTALINIEIREFAWTTNNCGELHSFLVDNGYKLIDQGEIAKTNQLEDKLYQRTDWK